MKMILQSYEINPEKRAYYGSLIDTMRAKMILNVLIINKSYS